MFDNRLNLPVIMGLRGGRRSRSGVLAVVLLGASACGVEAELEIGSSMEALYYRTEKLWDKRDIDVCWRTSGNATEKEWVRQALKGQRSWESVGNINFVGWDDCTEVEDIRISSNDKMVTYYGDEMTYAAMDLDFRPDVHTRYTRCIENGLDRKDCIQTVALHEFGHALGFAHEHNRPDKDLAECTNTPNGSLGDATYGAFDVDSIMAYCDFTTELSGTDVRGTSDLYGYHNGDHGKAGDYNGDGRADILCHERTDGQFWIDYSSGVGDLFAGTDWDRDNDWCYSNSARLYKGDFNGDGRTDLMCHNLSNGYLHVDLANVSGQFFGTNWSRNANWCRSEGAFLLMGDFNGDGRDDMLCHNADNGWKHIDYADVNGQFWGTDWSRDADWCQAAGGRLHVGDFNGDSRDDLLCHNVDNGYIHIDYADVSGAFWGTNWSRDSNWCVFAGAELRVGDFNGDGKDDLLCHNAWSGEKYIDYADGNGHFLGTDWYRNGGWCLSNGTRLFVGDFNNDNRDDILCHKVDTGQKWVDYADVNGQFNGSNWYRDAQWCRVDQSKLH